MAFVPSLYRLLPSRAKPRRELIIMTKDNLAKALDAMEQAQTELDRLVAHVDAGHPVDTRLLHQHQHTVNHAANYARSALRNEQTRTMIPVLHLTVR